MSALLILLATFVAYRYVTGRLHEERPEAKPDNVVEFKRRK